MSEHSPTASAVTALVEAATAAPSMHNAQPWRFRYAAATCTLELRPDPDRSMPRADPDDRALHLGCGAALFNLRVAAAHAGRHPQTALLPDPDDPQLLATVRLAATDRPSPGLAALYPAIPQRHTSRRPFADQDIPAELRDRLSGAARAEGAELAFPDPWHAAHLLDLVADAEGRDSLDPSRFEDVARWTRLGDASSPDGIPEYAFGPRKRDGAAPVRDFAGRRPGADRGSAAFEGVPHIALLGTAHDGRADWLRAGQAMERVLLLATLADLATAITSHALEWPDLRELVRDPTSAMGHVQILLRLGYGPPGPATPRRPVHEVLQIDT
ncbi:nitroreductase [Streptomyces sp. A7024]|uniref:Nitroreductase n=1 Tax=Streptomyces coryli TaxID=1128680 RepID=A0A6G4TSF4_9ACTN|nr:nitroreductase [Streptomyces coryli]NGN62480.1 nitroreductase [Streptomyces coryli]